MDKGISHYALNCEKCGEPYHNKEGFPAPQLCDKCLKIEELVEWGAKHIPTGQKLNRQQVLDITEAILNAETDTHRIAVIPKGDQPLIFNKKEGRYRIL